MNVEAPESYLSFTSTAVVPNVGIFPDRPRAGRGT